MKRPNILFLMSDEQPEYAGRVAAFRRRLAELGHRWDAVQTKGTA